MPTVITIHDMLYWSHPELMSTPLYTRPVKWMEKRGAANAAHVITDSQVSADEIVQVPRLPARAPARRAAGGRRTAAGRRRRARDRRTWSLASGQRRPHKNWDRPDPGAGPRRGGRPAAPGHHRRRGARTRSPPVVAETGLARLGRAARLGGRRRAGRSALARPGDGVPDARRGLRAAGPRGDGRRAARDRLRPAGAPRGRRRRRPLVRPARPRARSPTRSAPWRPDPRCCAHGRGRARAGPAFTWERVAEETLEVFRPALADRR